MKKEFDGISRSFFFVRTRAQGIMQHICNKIALSDTVVPSDAACRKQFLSHKCSNEFFQHSPESTVAQCSPFAIKSHP